MKRAARLLLLVIALVSCTEAQEPTQIMVVVDGDYDGFTRVEIDVEGFEENPKPVVIDDLGRRPLPRRLALLHNGGPLGPIDVTVRAWVDKLPGPVRIEPRRELRFVRGQTRMLKVDLLWDCIRNMCPDACQAGQCVSIAQASKLSPWDADFDRIEVEHMIGLGDVLTKDDGGAVVPADTGMNEDSQVTGGGSGGDTAGSGGSTRDDAGKDSGPPVIDAGPPEAAAAFPYTPTNFDPDAITAAADERPAVMLDCPLAQFDSSTMEFGEWCGDKPLASVIQQPGGGEAALLVMSTLTIENATSLQLVGDKPVILAIFGDAQIAGQIDAGAHGVVSGPGGGACTSGAGSSGPAGDSDGTVGAGGGSGGGFGTPGGPGGGGGASNSALAAGGGNEGGATLSPLRGGCAGGRGGAGTTSGGVGGGGGGALQISSAGDFYLVGKISAGGGGGMMGVEAGDGGGGGGSGGAILIEAVKWMIDSQATIAANGGGGGGGQPTSRVGSTSTAGADGSASINAAVGGAGSNSGGSGGGGAHMVGAAREGQNGSFVLERGGGGGGGGGGTGRIRINQADACAPRGEFSPLPSVDCPKCAAGCPATMMMPASDCVPHARGATVYYVCPGVLPYADALARCRSVGAELVRLEDAAENDWLIVQIGDTPVWIGASDFTTEGDWLWVDDDSLFWRGTSLGDPVGGMFSDWASGEPNQTGDCARAESTGWHDHSCTNSLAYVCEQ